MKMASTCCFVSFLAAGWISGCVNHAPELFPITNKVVKTGETLEFDIKAVDDDGDRLKFAIEDTPSAAKFEQVGSSTARFQWTPLSSDAGTEESGKDYSVTFVVTDGIDKDSESVIIRVTQGGANSGAPVFITPSDFTLDLGRSDEIRFSVEVRDTDSPEVEIRLVKDIQGAEFLTMPGSKMAAFRWRPTPEQIAERPVWGVRAGASDAVSPEVFQDITILLQGGQIKCEGSEPAVEHNALPDQRGSQDYEISVRASDLDSDISSVALYWQIDRGDSIAGSFESKEMAPSGQVSTWIGSIPNPNLAPGQSATVVYYICATDNDDATGDACDQRTCIPVESRFAFSAYASGSNQCEDDDFEANDSTANPTEVEFDQGGESVFSGLKVCPGNPDWFRLETPAHRRVRARINFPPLNGMLKLALIAEDGSTIVATGHQQADSVVVESGVFSQDETHFLKVHGVDGEVENRYDLWTAVTEELSCDQDEFEPNETPVQARTVTEEVYTELSCCGEPDWYKINLAAGQKLDVLIEFEHQEGDLDLWIFDQATVDRSEEFDCASSLDCSTSTEDSEDVQLPNASGDGATYILVAPYQEAITTYQMAVEVGQLPACEDDSNEDNDQASEATDIHQAGPISGLAICAHDVDWFKIHRTQGEQLNLEVTFTHAQGDLDVKLYSAGVVSAAPDDWQELELAIGVSTDDNETIDYPAAQTGDLYLRIYGYGSDANTYSMNVGL